MTETSRPYIAVANRDDWETPHALFDSLWEKYEGFDLDPCGQSEVHYSAWRIVANGGKAYDGSTEALDGLTQPWHGKVFCNPPYGGGVYQWAKRCHDEVSSGGATLVVALLKSTTDVKWGWHFVEDCPYASVQFIKGRLKFVGAKASAPFPSVIVTWQK